MKYLTLLVAVILLSTPTAFSAEPQGELAIHTMRPSSGSIPRGAQRVALLNATFTASCSADVAVQEIHVHHAGLGAFEDIAALYATDGKVRIGRSTSFNSNDRPATVRLARFTVPKCTRKTLIIAADFSTTASNGGEHRAELRSKDDILSTAAVVSVIADASGGTLRTNPSATGTITVTYPPLRSSVKYGENRTVARLQLEADRQNNHMITSIMLTNSGKARNADLQNLKLETSAGETLSATLAQLNGSIATFILKEPLILRKGQSRVVNVLADVRAGSKKTIRFVVEEAADIQSTIAKQRGQRFQ